MTLLEMIKKYEGIKTKLGQVYKRDAITQIETVEAILKDLKSIRDQQPSWVTLRVKILDKIDQAITNDNPDDAHTWTQVLSRLPS